MQNARGEEKHMRSGWIVALVASLIIVIYQRTRIEHTERKVFSLNKAVAIQLTHALDKLEAGRSAEATELMERLYFSAAQAAFEDKMANSDPTLATFRLETL